MTSPGSLPPDGPPAEALPSRELLLFSGLLAKAAELGNRELVNLYVQMAEASGVPRPELLSEALQLSPQNPLLRSLT